MGRRARIKPERLAEKLLDIRNALGLSQSGMLRQLGFDGLIDYRRISEFELGANEPPLPVLLAYARLAGVHLEILVDDDLELPPKLSGNLKHRRPSRKSSRKGTRRLASRAKKR
ncbi:MAG: helix-turn-helix domain-containing protein [Pyrinomonadaceae bacterium]